MVRKKERHLLVRVELLESDGIDPLLMERNDLEEMKKVWLQEMNWNCFHN